jgi:hypothetical protein
MNVASKIAMGIVRTRASDRWTGNLFRRKFQEMLPEQAYRPGFDSPVNLGVTAVFVSAYTGPTVDGHDTFLGLGFAPVGNAFFVFSLFVAVLAALQGRQ